MHACRRAPGEVRSEQSQRAPLWLIPHTQPRARTFCVYMRTFSLRTLWSVARSACCPALATTHLSVLRVARSAADDGSWQKNLDSQLDTLSLVTSQDAETLAHARITSHDAEIFTSDSHSGPAHPAPQCVQGVVQGGLC
jgi:hypothetical protein